MTGASAPAPDLEFLDFCRVVGVDLYPWQRDAFGQATERVGGRFRYRLAGISEPRGNGKSYAAAAAALWRLACSPQADIVSAALDLDGARIVLGHAKAIARGFPPLERELEIRANGLYLPSTGSRWTITSREHTASRGRHPDLVIYDEVGWARDDELFASLLAGQASVEDPLMLVVSTVGRRRTGPLWSVKQLAEGAAEGVLWWWSGENGSPRISPDFLERQRRILLPGQFAREHQNTWVDAADSLVTRVQVDAAMEAGWHGRLEAPPSDGCVAFVDLGAVHDPTAIAVGHQSADGIARIDRLLTFQGSREEPVSLAAVEHAIADLCRRFHLRRVRIESWQGLSAVQRLTRLGLPAELYTPTSSTNAEEWPLLASRFSARTIQIPPHARLREELLNLTVELGPRGVRVVDKGQVHQDHAVAVRGVVAMLASKQVQQAGVW